VRISLGKAAELAGVPTKIEMMAALAKHGVWLNYTAEDARKPGDIEDAPSGMTAVCNSSPTVSSPAPSTRWSRWASGWSVGSARDDAGCGVPNDTNGDTVAATSDLHPV